MISTSEKWLTVLLVGGLVGSGVYCFQRWVIYAHPAQSFNSEATTRENRAIRRNVTTRTTTTTPTVVGTLIANVVTVVEEKDTTTEESAAVSSTLASSLSTPVFPPGWTLGIQGYKDVVGTGWLGGVVVKPFDFLELGLMTNESFNKLYLGGTVPLK
jgi:hypothetical protein